ncbi:MAG: hypothetical protein Q7T46_10440 [Polaromonas sp.]|nr:hypothetical protein [Polaromonas sp.]
MTPQDFIQKWGPGGPAFQLNEEQGAQSHFLDLCELLDVHKPGSEAGYLFEEKNSIIGGRTGYADVFRRGVFAWENKAPGKNLDAALRQLQSYSLALSNPPILVVCDRLTIRIYTQFTGHPTETHTVLLPELDQPDKLALLRRIWTAPESFRPKKTSRDITEEAAKSFATLADGLRKRGPSKEQDAQAFQTHADEVAHFLTQCLFCFFSEDVGLLPGRMFEGLVNNRKLTSDKLTVGLSNLFTVMREGGLYGNDDIPWFNGGLFKKIKVPQLTVMEMTELRNAAALNWSAIDVSIFGTLFERGLDPSKRSQLGAHYTDPATIMRIIEPVLQRPLLQIWELLAPVIKGLLAKSTKKGDKNYKAAQAKFIGWLDQLKNYRVLDPACGSGNFLFLGLKTLKDIEHQSHLAAAAMGLDREADLVTGPHNMLGIELNEYAAELARVTVWIGELQWRLLHGYEFKTNPVLEPLDHIECRDALVDFLPPPLEEGRDGGSPRAVEAVWPRASVVIGNPPFLGGSKKRRELGDAYFETLDTVFAGRVPGGADLVCYWFDKARQAIETHGLGAAGLVATQSIRSGSNRAVLDAIRQNTRIFDAWSDEAWVNDGAAVRVSLVSFGWGECCFLNGKSVEQITSELGSSVVSDMSLAKPLPENAGISFEGTKKYGDFDISGELARSWLQKPNPHGRPNSDVVKPWRNGQDITRRPSDTWVIDFGAYTLEADASLYDAPFSHLVRSVKSERMKVRRERTRRLWWIHEEARVSLRDALNGLPRFIATPRVSKYRFFVFLDATVLPDTRLNVVARADDLTFGVLSSRIHEVWSLANASMHGVGNDPTYNAKSCFETFAFPDYTDLQSDVKPAIARAAKRLNNLREAWLNPPEWTQRVPEVVPLGMSVSPYPDRILPKPGHEKDLAERTLTKLYNQRPAWLDAARQELDAAVAAAYGWTDYRADMPDEEILKRLLALNLARAGAR